MLVDEVLEPVDSAFSSAAAEFVRAARARFKTVDCFDFVPSDYELVWRVLDGLPRNRFCEWGSGWGIVTGLAEFLGFDSCGIELDENLVVESRRLLSDHSLTSPILHGDYLAIEKLADTYFVYCWPTRMRATEEYFERFAPPGARLVVAHGQSDLRCKVKPPGLD